METMTLELILVNDEKEKLLKFLEENCICYERYGSSYSAFLEEEARCQLENFLYPLIIEHLHILFDKYQNENEQGRFYYR